MEGGGVDSRGVKYNCEKGVYSAFIIDGKGIKSGKEGYILGRPQYT